MTRSLYDHDIANAADREITGALDDLIKGAPSIQMEDSQHHAVVIAAPAGAGKSYLVGTAVETLCEVDPDAPQLVLVCAPTNEQIWDLTVNLASRLPDERIAIMPASSKHPPERVTSVPNVDVVTAAEANDCRIVVATLNKAADAHGRGDLISGFHFLLIDEAYQASSAHYFGVGGLADRHLLVGDPGQISPFTSMPDPDRWRGLEEDPVSSAVTVLCRIHPQVPTYRLPITRRLPPSAIAVCSSFYPDHGFGAWVTPEARELTLTAGHKNGSAAEVDRALDLAVDTGWAWVRLPERAVLQADPDSIDVISQLVARTIERDATTTSERNRRPRSLAQDRIAVSVSHNDQKDFLLVKLDELGLGDVVVDTANKLQGLEFDLTVAWHPLAGLAETDAFHLEPGRMCVMTTRHRHACIVVGRRSDADLLGGVPPAAEAWADGEMSPEVDGWFAHKATFAQLAHVAVDIT